jgi:hypothetical protein
MMFGRINELRLTGSSRRASSALVAAARARLRPRATATHWKGEQKQWAIRVK